jgi:NhaP-type Na+/H+ or K+/H+ antiporter
MTTLMNILSTVTGQLGPAYDPLFYDFMVYAFGSIIFIIIVAAIIIPILMRRKKKKPTKRDDDTQVWR